MIQKRLLKLIMVWLILLGSIGHVKAAASDENVAFNESKNSKNIEKEIMNLNTPNDINYRGKDGTSWISNFSVVNDKPEYLSGQTGTTYVRFSITESEDPIQNAVLQVKIPAEYIEPGTIRPTMFSSAESVSVTLEEEGKYYYVRYYLKDIDGGANVDVPITWVTKNGMTPDGYDLIISAIMIVEGTPVAGAEASAVTKIKILEPYIQKNIFEPMPTTGYIGGVIYTYRDGLTYNLGKADLNNPGYLTANEADLIPIKFSITINFPSTFGQRNYKEFYVTDRLPEGAVFKQSLNPGWVYDEETHTATYTQILSGEGTKNIQQWSRYPIVLLFPGAKLNELKTNKMELTMVPPNQQQYETDFYDEDTITFKITGTTPPPPKKEIVFRKIAKTNAQFMDTPDMKENRELPFEIWIKNDNNLELDLENIVINDNKLNSNLKFSKLIVYRYDGSKVPNYRIIVTYEDGTEEIVQYSLQENNPVTQLKEIYVFKDKAVAFRYEMLEGAKLVPGGMIILHPYVKIRNPETTFATLTMPNTASLSTNYVGETATIKKEATASFKLLPFNTIVDFEKVYGTGTYVNNRYVEVGEKLNYRLEFDVVQIGQGSVIEGVKIIDFIPFGNQYVPGSATIGLRGSAPVTDFDIQFDLGPMEPEIIYNYKNTGKTALVWSLGDIKANRSLQYTGSSFLINYQVEVTKYTVHGPNRNSAYLAWYNAKGRNQGEVLFDTRTKYLYTDRNDFNDNGYTDDVMVWGFLDFNFNDVKEFLISKTVKGYLDKTFSDSGLSELARRGQYKFMVVNNTNTEYTEMTFIDLLPKPGDLTAGGDLQGNRFNRNSDFPITLAGPITVPSKFDVFYSTADTSEYTDIKDFIENGEWVSSLEDYSAATCFKLVLKENEVFKPGEYIEFFMDFNVPFDITLDNESQAVNSFGTYNNITTSITESNFIKLNIVKYKVDGYVFDDFDKNGVFDPEKESPFGNYTVTLLNEDGSIAKDPSGKPYVTTTDETGYYSIDVYHNGEYKIQVKTPEGYELTLFEYQKNYDYGSGINPETPEMSDSFTLNIDNPLERRNAGYYRIPTYIDISVKKEWDDGENRDGKRPDSITIHLLANGVEAASATVTAADGWQWTFSNLAEYSEGKKIDYTVTEEAVTDYTTTQDGFNFTNSYTPETIDVAVRGNWDDGNNQDGIRPDSIIVRLLANGIEVASAAVTEADGWQWTFTDLPKYYDGGKEIDYTVTEDAVTDYTTAQDGYNFTNSHTPETVDVAGSCAWNDENDKDGKRPDSIMVSLLANGVEVASATVTAADGWAWSFAGLDKYENGEQIVYTITGDEVAGYTTEVTGFDIKNTYVPVVMEVVPKTGDNFNPAIWFAIMLISLIAMVSLSVYQYNSGRQTV